MNVVFKFMKRFCAITFKCQDLSDINEVNVEKAWCKDKIMTNNNGQFDQAGAELFQVQIKLYFPTKWG